MTTIQGYDHLNRYPSIASSSFSSSFDYKYNAASQRTSVANVAGSYWEYGCDSLGQVTSGKK